MSWITTTNTIFKVGDKVRVVNDVYKEFLGKIFTIEALTIDKKLCVLKEIKPFKIFQTKYLKLANILEIE